ncbi:MAG: recombination protein O N-terminal domain-containing protein [Paludibacteraceae bacterium]|nr:recombination protein O N-terminal domain-containing protein [Paludibacteraceae bacterium]
MPAGIVLSLTKFSDTGSIVHLYTSEQGRMQYAIYGNKYKGILRPLSIVEFTANHRNNAPNQLSTLSDCQLLFINSQLATDIQRQCVAMFIAEVLISTLRHPMNDQPLFDWLCEVVKHLDVDTDISNLHLYFLLEYANHLGIGIDDTEHPDWYELPTSRKERQQRLRELCIYYTEHIEDFRQPKSLEVLMEVFD